MKKLFNSLLVLSIMLISCKSTGSIASIQPKSGKLTLPVKGELRIWKDILHPSFTVTLSNSSATQSCEVYTVNDSGYEKWVNPSLLAGTSLTVKVPANGHLFFKNFNNNVFTVNYQVNE